MMKTETLTKILEAHKLWLHHKGGQRANLRGAVLRGAVLSDADLSRADLSRAVLNRADLSRADLSRADLSRADLRGADLSGADLRDASLSGASLSGADLRDASLSGADLSGADLWSVIGNKYQIKSMQLETYSITYTAEVIQIGCQRHTIDEWRKFDDGTIAGMDTDAFGWWCKWKDFIFKAIELSPAEE